MDKEQLKQRLAKLKNDLAKKQKKLQKCERLAKAHEHVTKKIREHAQLMLQDPMVDTPYSHVHTKVSFEEQHRNEDSCTKMMSLSDKHSVEFQLNQNSKVESRTKPCEILKSSPAEQLVISLNTEPNVTRQNSTHTHAFSVNCRSNRKVIGVPESESPGYGCSVSNILPNASNDELLMPGDSNPPHNSDPTLGNSFEIENPNRTYVLVEKRNTSIENYFLDINLVENIVSQDSVDTLDSDLETSLDRRVRRGRRRSQQLSGESVQIRPLLLDNRPIETAVDENLVSHKGFDDKLTVSESNQQDVCLAVNSHDPNQISYSVAIGEYETGRVELDGMTQSESQMPEDEGNMAFIIDGDTDSHDTMQQSLSTQQATKCVISQCNITKRLIPTIKCDSPDKNDVAELELILQMQPQQYYDTINNADPEKAHSKNNSQEGLLMRKPNCKVRMNSEATMLDFSYLEEETGDMYSQIKSRKNRRDHHSFPDCDHVALLPDESLMLRKLTNKHIHITDDFEEKADIVDMLTVGETKPLSVFHDPDIIIKNLTKDEDSSSPSLIRNKPSWQNKSTSGEVQALFPKIHVDGNSQASEFSLPPSDYGKLMENKSISPGTYVQDIESVVLSITRTPLYEDENKMGIKCCHKSDDLKIMSSLSESKHINKKIKNEAPTEIISAENCELPIKPDNVLVDLAMVQNESCIVLPRETVFEAELVTDSHTPDICSQWSQSMDSNSLLLDSADKEAGPLLSYHSSVKYGEPLICLRSGFRGPGRHQEIVIGCTSLRVLVWAPQGRGWRVIREWSREQLQAECITSCELLPNSTDVYILSTTRNCTQLTTGCTEQGDPSLQLQWNTDELCTKSDKHYCLVLSDRELIVGSITQRGNTQLQKVVLPCTLGLQNPSQSARSFELDEVTDHLVSLVRIDGQPDALLGASQSTLYIWDHTTGRHIHTVVLRENLFSCSVIYHQKGLLFMAVITAANKTGVVLIVNPVTGGSCILHQLTTNHIGKNHGLTSLLCNSSYLCGQDDEGSINMWCMNTGQLLVYADTVPVHTILHLHINRLLVANNTVIHVYKINH